MLNVLYIIDRWHNYTLGQLIFKIALDSTKLRCHRFNNIKTNYILEETKKANEQIKKQQLLLDYFKVGETVEFCTLYAIKPFFVTMRVNVDIE